MRQFSLKSRDRTFTCNVCYIYVRKLVRLCNSFTVPLTKEFVQKTWGDGAFKKPSGLSAVIVVPSKQSVFKRPLLAVDLLRLNELLYTKSQSAEKMLAWQPSNGFSIILVNTCLDHQCRYGLHLYMSHLVPLLSFLSTE